MRPLQLAGSALTVFSLLTAFGYAGPLNNTSKHFRRGSQKSFEEAISRPYQQTIVAIGDIHGAYDETVTALKLAGVVDDEVEWTGKVNVLVQIGDVVDRGDYSIEVYQLFKYLSEAAEAHGDKVVNLRGNHEMMNLYGDWRLVSEGDIERNGGTEARQRLFREGWLADTLKDDYLISARVPLHSAIGPINTDYDPRDDKIFRKLKRAALSFTHGGFAGPVDPDTPYPSSVNKDGRDAVDAILSTSTAPHLQLKDSDPKYQLPQNLPGRLVNLLTSTASPLWYRGWALLEEDIACYNVDGVLRSLGSRRMILGHHANLRGIVSRCGGKILLIDTGMSPAMGGVVSAIKFEYSWKKKPANPYGGKWRNSAQQYEEREIVSAIYKEGPKVILDEPAVVTFNTVNSVSQDEEEQGV